MDDIKNLSPPHIHSQTLVNEVMQQVIFALVPPITAVTGLMVLHETLSLKHWLGITVTVRIKTAMTQTAMSIKGYIMAVTIFDSSRCLFSMKMAIDIRLAGRVPVTSPTLIMLI